MGDKEMARNLITKYQLYLLEKRIGKRQFSKLSASQKRAVVQLLNLPVSPPAIPENKVLKMATMVAGDYLIERNLEKPGSIPLIILRIHSGFPSENRDYTIATDGDDYYECHLWYPVLYEDCIDRVINIDGENVMCKIEKINNPPRKLRKACKRAIERWHATLA